MDFIKGENRILHLLISGVFYPVGCLTENSFSETAEMLDTTTRETNGWATSQAVKQSYSLTFSGLQINSSLFGGDTSKISYDTLKQMKRNRLVIGWQVKGEQVPNIDYGYCSITELSESTPVGEFITFSGTLTGFGRPFMTNDILERTYVQFQNGNNQILQNNDKYIYK